MPAHTYRARVQWSGSTARGYRDYPRAHSAFLPPATEGLDLSADEHFRGDPDLPNPEQLLVLAASSCQLLSFLALAALRHVDVRGYEDEADGVMPADALPQRITQITLRPRITVAPDADEELVWQLVHEAHEECYIANSLTTAVMVEPRVVHG
jgi:organic hydroperoxide reductase OsmC/OhrA